LLPGQYQYPPHMAAGAGYGYPPDQQSGPNGNDFSPYLGPYLPPPQLYGDYTNPQAMTAPGYQGYPPYYQMQYGGPPPHGQYPPFSHPPSHPQYCGPPQDGGPPHYGNVPPSSAGHMRNKLMSSACLPSPSSSHENVAASYTSQHFGYLNYPPNDNMPNGASPPEQYPPFSHPQGPLFGAPSHYGDVPSSASSAPMKSGEVAADPASCLLPHNIFAEQDKSLKDEPR